MFAFLRKRPKLLAAFSYRYDADLIPDLLKNIGPFIDGYVSWDDRQNTGLWRHCGRMNNWLTEAARAQGANWVLHVDPDERFEREAGWRIRRLIRRTGKIIYGFRFREMWSPDSYRTDGIWGQKVKWVLFPLLPEQHFMCLPVHSQVSPQDPEYQRLPTELNLYHMKMIHPPHRRDRMNLFKYLDPENKIQSIGYDYLNDETGLTVEKIPRGRQFDPPYDPAYRIHQITCPSSPPLKGSH
jgi:hypothetical protein